MARAEFRSDYEYLRDEQYKDSRNLRARGQLHHRFSVNKYGFQRWIFDQFEFESGAVILELGCGAGWLWVDNVDRVTPEWQMVLSDFSPGMVTDARNALQQCDLTAPTFLVVDAQEIPLNEGSVDAVVANHMLYLVPDRHRVFHEIQRVLHPHGVLYATTNGLRHMKELGDLVRECIPSYVPRNETLEFHLEAGYKELTALFGKVELTRYEDALCVTEAEALEEWTRSWAPKLYSEQTIVHLSSFLRERLRINDGEIHVSKESGLLQARNCVG